MHLKFFGSVTVLGVLLVFDAGCNSTSGTTGSGGSTAASGSNSSSKTSTGSAMMTGTGTGTSSNTTASSSVSGSSSSGTAQTGCYGLLKCVDACADSACQTACVQNTTMNGQMLFKALYNCVLTTCPNKNGGICDKTAPGFSSAACQSCVSMAQMQNGACYSQEQSCLSDKP